MAGSHELANHKKRGMAQNEGREGAHLMVSALDSESSGLGSSLMWGKRCVLGQDTLL